MSPISRRSLIAVLVVTALMTVLLALPLQAAPYASPVKPPHAVCSGFFYRVQKGDTLSSIAAHYGTSVSKLASCNGISNANRIFAGMVIVIPSGKVVYPPVYKPGPVYGACGFYKVRFGDTLSGIAMHYGVNTWELAAANGIKHADFIWAGQVLRLPCGGHGYGGKVSYDGKYGMHAGWYKVVRGDTIYGIAARCGKSHMDIIRANGLRYPYMIYAGQWLRI